MGGGRWTSDKWDTYASSHVRGKTVDEIYTSTKLHKDFDPKEITARESRDSLDNPESTALIIGVDVTGSMGMIADNIIKKGLNVLFTEIYDRKPVSDPHIMAVAIGDADMHDRAPLQITQFEADIRIAEQLKEIYLEHGGGGNDFESYHLPWYFAAMHTEIDCFEKRGKKGYLFTIGDEFPPPSLSVKAQERVFGPGQYKEIPITDVLAMAQEKYEVFHIVVEQGHCCRMCGAEKVHQKWAELMGQNAIPMSDYNCLAEIIVSTIQIREGADKSAVVGSWDGTTSVAVSKAVDGITSDVVSSDGYVEL